jgi:L-seryl-tRNA(Ser) seleniumtransferase
MQGLADTRPVGIGSFGAGASGMRGRRADQPRDPGQAAASRDQATPSQTTSPTPNATVQKPTTDTPARPRRPERDPQTFGFAVWQLKEGEDKLIADRLTEIFSNAPKA